jgi:hypothetical protein
MTSSLIMAKIDLPDLCLIMSVGWFGSEKLAVNAGEAAGGEPGGPMWQSSVRTKLPQSIYFVEK